MTDLVNNFESGTNTTGLTTGNTSGTGANAFDTVSTAGGTSIAFSSAQAAHGSLSALVTIPASAGQAAYAAWSTSLTASATSSTLYSRLYVRYASLPGTTVAILRGLSAGSQRWRVSIDTSGHVVVANAAGSTIGTSTTVLTTGAWWRVECAAAASTSGTIEVRIFSADSTSATETLGPYTSQALGGPVAEIRYGCAASAAPASTVTYYVDDAGASTTTWLGPNAPVPVVQWQWTGAVTDTSIACSYGITNTSSARLVVSTNSSLTSPVYSSAVAPDSDGVVKLSKTGLTADTQYYYGIEADGTTLATGRGSFKTDPAAGSASSFSIAFGSCMQTNSNTVALATAAAHTGTYGKARRFIHEGDLHYRDFGSGTTQADITAQYKSSLAPSNMQTLLTTVPTTYTWDNHDWGGQDSYSGSPIASVMKTGYRQFVPSYALPADTSGGGTGGIWQTWVIGRVRFIMIDTRSQRSSRLDADGPSKTLLGSEQKAWFKTQLLQPEPVKIIVSGIYWRFDAVNGDRWGSYYTEWTELKSFIQSNGVKAFVIFGDRHALCADNGTSPNTYLPMAGGAPLDQGSTPASETWSAGYYDTGGSNLKGFGWLDVTDTGSAITIAYTGYTSDEVARVSMSTTYSAPSAAPVGAWGVYL